MKKTFALIGMGFATIGTSAFAADVSPYAALRLTGSIMNNDAAVVSDYSFGGVTHHINTLANETHSDFVFGVNAGVGASVELPYGALRGEIAFDWKSEAKDMNEFEFAISNNYTHEFETKTSVYDVMLNLYYDFDTGTAFVPFIGAGLGYGHIAIESTGRGNVPTGAFELPVELQADNFVWNVGAGIAYELTENLAIDLMYRYTNYGSVDTSVALEVQGLGAKLPVDADFDVATHEFLLGARYTF